MSQEPLPEYAERFTTLVIIIIIIIIIIYLLKQ